MNDLNGLNTLNGYALYRGFSKATDVEKTSLSEMLGGRGTDSLINSKFMEMFRQAETSIEIRLGEMFTFDNENFVERVQRELEKKPHDFSLSVTCGNIVVCGTTDKNANRNLFIKMLQDFARRDKSVEVKYIPGETFYNPLEVVAQVNGGYLHTLIVDGKDTYMEAPSGYLQKLHPEGQPPAFDRQWIIAQDNELFAERVRGYHRNYAACAGAITVSGNAGADFDIIHRKTRTWEEYQKRGKDLAFYDWKDFLKKLAAYQQGERFELAV